MGPKWCMNYDSGDYEWIDENGYSWDQGEYVYNWDRSAFDDEDDDDDWQQQKRPHFLKNNWDLWPFCYKTTTL